MNILRIDTSDNLKTKVELENYGKITLLNEARKTPGDQNVLELVDKLLTKQGLTLKEINGLEVNTGPGSFTGLRVGASIANALSFGIQVSVNGKPLGEVVEPTY